MSKNITEIQHYVPQFFQRQWAFDKNMQVYKLDIKKDKIGKAVSIKMNCQESFLYEFDKKKPDNFIEDELGKMETKYSNIVQKQIPFLESGIKANFSIKELEVLYEYITLSILRTPFEINKIEQEPILKYFRNEDETEEEFRREFPRMMLRFINDTWLYKAIKMGKNKTIISSGNICYSEKIPYLIHDDGITAQIYFLAFPLSPKLLFVVSEEKIPPYHCVDFYHNLLYKNCNFIYSNKKEVLNMFNCFKKR